MSLTSMIASMALWLFASQTIQAQLADHLFGIHNPNSGVFRFASLSLTTGTVTNMQTLPMSSISGGASATIDMAEVRYLFSTGTQLFTLDPLNTASMSMTVLPLAPNANFISIEWNPCDNLIYGIITESPGPPVFASYDRVSNTFLEIVELDATMVFALGGNSYIDPMNGVYGLHHGNYILGIDLMNGMVLYDTPIITIPNETFGHISFDCQRNTIIGTSAGPHPEGGNVKWLSSLDPLTGTVSHLSSAHTQAGYMKPALTGSTVDQQNGVFHWGGVNGEWVSANVATGAILNVIQASSTQPLYSIAHFSGCACGTSVTGLDRNTLQLAYPNPATTHVLLTGQNTSLGVRWVDAQGRSLQVPIHAMHNGLLADISSLLPGVYTAFTPNGLVWRIVVSY